MAPAAILLVILTAAISLARALSRDGVIDRRVRRARRLAVSELADGVVAAVRGRARAADGGDALMAPLSRRACIYYEVEVQAFDPGSVMWVTLYVEGRGRAFFLEQDGEAVLVEPGSWRISVDRDARFAPAGAASAAVRALLARRGSAWVCRRRLRARERVLRDGQLVAALGTVVCEPDPDPAAAPVDYRSAALHRVLRSGRGAPLYITDHVDT